MLSPVSTFLHYTHLRLERTFSTNFSTQGVLFAYRSDGGFDSFHTLELAWRHNDLALSCIPPGTFSVFPFRHPRFGLAPIIKGVPARQDIFFRAFQTNTDCRGSIALVCDPRSTFLFSILSAVIRSKHTNFFQSGCFLVVSWLFVISRCFLVSVFSVLASWLVNRFIASLYLCNTP
jgi:hypothetical protein